MWWGLGGCFEPKNAGLSLFESFLGVLLFLWWWLVFCLFLCAVVCGFGVVCRFGFGFLVGWFFWCSWWLVCGVVCCLFVCGFSRVVGVVCFSVCLLFVCSVLCGVADGWWVMVVVLVVHLVRVKG